MTSSVKEPGVLLSATLGFFAVLSLALMLWQWFVAWRFPLHTRVGAHSFAPAVTLLKPLKGCDSYTEKCLKSWFSQDYAGPLQILFGVASADDPVCEAVRKLLREHPGIDAELIVCGPPPGANSKVSKLVELARLARHEILIISDADVRAPSDFLANAVAPLRNPETGLVNCFYRLANPATLAMQWEAVAINADFWSQVLQAKSLKPLDFALGAVMAVRREQLKEIGGFMALVNCLADDYHLGNRIARGGQVISLLPVVVECWSEPMGWSAVWAHQLRWARTIRVCQPVPYFFSILSNPTLWPALWLAVNPSRPVLAFCLGCLGLRIASAAHLQQKLTGTRKHYSYSWLVPLKDLLQTAIWLAAFAGNIIQWRGQKMRLRKDGTLQKC